MGIKKARDTKMLKNNKYAIPYRGSKRGISAPLLSALLGQRFRATHFVDLFGGGGAMTFCALDNGLKVHYNEIKTDLMELTRQSLKGIPREWDRWITKEEFNQIKKEKGAFAEFVRCVWSFGNGGTNYLYGEARVKDKEELYKLLTYNDTESLEYFSKKLNYSNLMGLNEIFAPLKREKRKAIWVNLCLKVESAFVSGLNQVSPYWRNMPLQEFMRMSNAILINAINEAIEAGVISPKIKEYKSSKGLKELKQLGRLEQLEQLQQLGRLEQLEQLQQLGRLERNITFSSVDYREVELSIFDKDKTIIYCDIPYKDTAGYGGEFDHDEFVKWCLKQKHSVFVSEYTHLDGLELLGSIDKMGLMASAKFATKKKELILWNER